MRKQQEAPEHSNLREVKERSVPDVQEIAPADFTDPEITWSHEVDLGQETETLQEDGSLGGPSWPVDEEGNPLSVPSPSVPSGYEEAAAEGAAPVLTSLTPGTAVVGGADLTLSVTGTGFLSDSVIVFNGGDEPTTFVSETELTTGVKPSTASGAAVIPVLVRNPGGLESNALDFTFTESAGE